MRSPSRDQNRFAWLDRAVGLAAANNLKVVLGRDGFWVGEKNQPIAGLIRIPAAL